MDNLWPIQLGAAVAATDGSVKGVWSFNLHFNVLEDKHTVKSVDFLRAAGIDFDRHKDEEQGIAARELGQLLRKSCLFGPAGSTRWITFSGAYDLGYLMKLLTMGVPLPEDLKAFDDKLSNFCPRRHELRDELPYGSLDSLAKKHGVKRVGAAHTAGSDALLTLELFLRVVGTHSRVLETRRHAELDTDTEHLGLHVATGHSGPWPTSYPPPLPAQSHWDYSWEFQVWESLWNYQPPPPMPWMPPPPPPLPHVHGASPFWSHPNGFTKFPVDPGLVSRTPQKATWAPPQHTPRVLEI